MSNYTVTGNTHISMVAPGGGQQIVYRVSILTDRGATGTVDIPKADYRAEVVRERLEELAGLLDMPFAGLGDEDG